MATRKQYSKEFKLDAVSLVKEQAYNRSEAARSLGINSTMLGRWVKDILKKATVFFAAETK
jgi:transposase